MTTETSNARGDVRGLVAKLAAHVRPTCSELWDEAQAFLAAEGVRAGEVEQRARELLAQAWEQRDHPATARRVREGGMAGEWHAVSLAAIVSALSQQPEARGVVDVEAIRSLAADMMTVVSEVDDIGALGSHVVAFANRLNALTAAQQQGQAVACECPIPLDDPPNMHAPGCVVRQPMQQGGGEAIEDDYLSRLDWLFKQRGHSNDDPIYSMFSAFVPNLQSLTAPPSAPVGVELSALRVQEWLHREHDILRPVQEIEQAMRTPCSCPVTERALAQQPTAVPNIGVGVDIVADRVYVTVVHREGHLDTVIYSEMHQLQPAAVDAAIISAATRLVRKAVQQSRTTSSVFTSDVSALAAALAAQENDDA